MKDVNIASTTEVEKLLHAIRMSAPILVVGGVFLAAPLVLGNAAILPVVAGGTMAASLILRAVKHAKRNKKLRQREQREIRMVRCL